MNKANITRNLESKCIMARVNRHGKRHQRNYTLKQYGTYDAAERAAKKWIGGMKKVLPPPGTTKNIITSRNSSGVVGVWLARNVKRKPNGLEYEYWRWMAFWPNCPFTGGLGWSINKHGDSDAFVLAVLSRKRESIDRNRILLELERLRGTEDYDNIIAIKNQAAP
jgi:hypothetical protein